MGELPLLLLWDIDLTLINVGQVSREIYATAFREVTGRELTRFAQMTGRTEQAIITDTLTLNGIDPRTSLDAFYTALGQAAHTLAPRMREVGRKLPGADQALAAFAGTGAVQTLVTGNLKTIAVAKLTAFGLDGFMDFEIGGYGDDGTDRATLVHLAIDRATRHHGRKYHPVVIGDTPHDVAGALAQHATAIAVATGHHTLEQLTRAGADLVLSDLTDLTPLLTLLGD